MPNDWSCGVCGGSTELRERDEEWDGQLVPVKWRECQNQECGHAWMPHEYEMELDEERARLKR